MPSKQRKTPQRHKNQRKPKKLPPPAIVQIAPDLFTKTIENATYGPIPLIGKAVRDRGTGKLHYIEWKVDPTFRPKIPPNAVVGDPTKQDPYYIPTYYYLDQKETCIQCKKDFIFSGQEQKYWYEELQFGQFSAPIRCPHCRHIQRVIKSLNQRISELKPQLEADPKQAEAQLELASTMIRLFSLSRQGDLKRAVGAARQAARLGADQGAALYWEARGLSLLGYSEKALGLYSNAIAVLDSSANQSPLLAQAHDERRELEAALQTQT
jgi:tetratricopeptide (TPR) repeat protein